MQNLQEQYLLAMDTFTTSTNRKTLEDYEKVEKQLRYAISMYAEAIKPLLEAQRELVACLEATEKDRLELEKELKASAIRYYAPKKSGVKKEKPVSIQDMLQNLSKEQIAELIAALSK